MECRGTAGTVATSNTGKPEESLSRYCSGVTAAFFARWQKSLGHGVGALSAGWLATAAALHFMPFVYFPFDQYPVGFLWMFELPLAVAVFHRDFLRFAFFVFRYQNPFVIALTVSSLLGSPVCSSSS